MKLQDKGGIKTSSLLCAQKTFNGSILRSEQMVTVKPTKCLESEQPENILLLQANKKQSFLDAFSD